MGWEVLSEGTFLTPASVSEICSIINDLILNWFKHIPEEIITNILVRLPIKSVVRCTSVCKSWRAIIKDPKFILTHKLKFNDQNATHLMLLHTVFLEPPTCPLANLFPNLYHQSGEFKESIYSLHFDNQGFDEYCKIEIPSGLKEIMVNPTYREVGTCNGLVCLVDDIEMPDSNSKLFLWNPCLRRYLALPEPSVTYSKCGDYEACVGICYDDAGNNDIKVVRVATLLDKYDSTVAQVYSLANGTWSLLRADLPRCFAGGNSLAQVYVNGIVHWLVLRRRTGRGPIYHVLTFDGGSEAFGEITLPKKFELEDPLDLKLAATGDRKSIALFVECRTETHAFVDIWVMKEHCVQNSWTKLMRLTPQGPERILPEAVCFRKSGEVLVVHEHSRELVALDLVNNRFKLLGVSGGQSCNADSYEESLVLLDKNAAISY